MFKKIKAYFFGLIIIAPIMAILILQFNGEMNALCLSVFLCVCEYG